MNKSVKWYAIRATTRVRHILVYDRERDVHKLHPSSVTACGQAICDDERGYDRSRDCLRCFGLDVRSGTN